MEMLPGFHSILTVSKLKTRMGHLSSHPRPLYIMNYTMMRTSL